MRFRDRQDAGRQLALRLLPYRVEHPLVLGLPRGGVPVAFEISRALEAPLDLWVARRVRAPTGETVGAVAQGGHLSLRPRMEGQGALLGDVLEEQIRQAAGEVGADDATLRGGRPPAPVEGRTVILADDGALTGETAHAAIESVRAAGARRVVLALGTAPAKVRAALEAEADAVVCLLSSEGPRTLGASYEDFRLPSDDALQALLSLANELWREPDLAREVRIPTPEGSLEGTLTLPRRPVGLVLFAHGSGSGRQSPRNRRVAERLQRHGLGTLLFDLLTPDEARVDARTGALRFDLGLLAERLTAASAWARVGRETAGLPQGYFGSSTGAAAALIASVEAPGVRAIVSRGGRPDLAMELLQRVEAPTLLVVGGEDREVLALNRRAYERLWAPRQLYILPGATHLFEEPGALEQVAALAADWFVRFLPIGLTAELTDSWA